MNYFKFEKSNKERGSATVEAVISFTGFLFVIFTILNIVNICRAQMLISNAVDTATKELTQYSYFYKMSGLQKFSEDLSDIADNGKTNLNDVLGTVNNLYTSIGTAVDNTTQRATDIQNAAEEGDLNLSSIQNTLAGIRSDGTNIVASMNSVSSAFDAVQDNPILYMKSIVAVAGNASLDFLKSHVIAAPLARMFVTKHFGSSAAEASEKLEKLGVVDGLDGMNFNMSSIFSSDEPEDVHIVVYYKLKLVSIFGWATLEAPICKESKARAWLAGDDVQKLVPPMVVATEPEDESNSVGSEDTENTENTENAEENNNASTGAWAVPVRSDDGYYMLRSKAFIDYMGEQYGCETNANYAFLSGHNRSTAYACISIKDADDISTGPMADPDLDTVTRRAYVDSVKELARLENQYEPAPEDRYYHNSFKPGEVKQIIYTVYVPENITDEQLNAIKARSEKGFAKYGSTASETLGRDIDIVVMYEKGGGNYDYGNGG